MKLIKKQSDSVKEPIITIEYIKWTEELDNISNMIEGRRASVAGYGKDGELYQIRTGAILYFEAVGDLVFAYTKDSVYEIKQRLYQIEEELKGSDVIRASKSVLLNIRKIQKLKPALNGRLYATLTNGEQVMITRSYSKEIKGVIMAS